MDSNFIEEPFRYKCHDLSRGQRDGFLRRISDFYIATDRYIGPRNVKLYLRKSGDSARKCFLCGPSDIYIYIYIYAIIIYFSPRTVERFTRLLILRLPLVGAFHLGLIYPPVKTFISILSRKSGTFFIAFLRSCFSFEAIKICHLGNDRY